MGRRTTARDAIFSVFSSPSWTSNNIRTVPTDVSVTENIEFIRVSIIDSGRPLNRNSVSGVMLIDIYSPAGKGPKRFDTIADLLDTYVLNKSLPTLRGSVQFSISTTSPVRPDTVNSALATTRYSIPFNLFEVN